MLENLNISELNKNPNLNLKRKNDAIKPNIRVSDSCADTVSISTKKRISKWEKLSKIIMSAIITTLGTAESIFGEKIPETKDSETKTEKSLQDSKQILNIFGTTSKYDNTISQLKIYEYGKNGLPLKYSRDSFLTDLSTELDKLSPAERTNIEKKFNVKLNPTTYNKVGVELEGIPTIPKNLSSENEQKIAKIIKNFTQQNEVLLEDTKAKMVLDSILEEIPEFTATIGKKQHRTHQFSVDIHTLKNLSSNLTDIKTKSLDDESKTVLKYATILHDLGKCFIADCCPDTGHAARSLEIAKPILERLNLKPEIKNRILKHIEHHHWFERYNKGEMAAQDVINLFGNKQDITIAEIMAKSDLANVNDRFQFKCMKILEEDTQKAWEIYEEKMQDKFNIINHMANEQNIK